MSPGPCRVCQDSARQSPDGYSDVSHIIFACLENQKPLVLHYVAFRYVSLRSVTFRYVTLRFVTFRSVPFRYVTLHLVMYRAGRPTSDLHHEDAPREDGYSSACWRRTLGRAGPWTQHVYSNRPSVRRHLRKGGQRASCRQEAASSLGSRRGVRRYSHDLAAGVGGPRQGAAGGTGVL